MVDHALNMVDFSVKNSTVRLWSTTWSLRSLVKSSRGIPLIQSFMSYSSTNLEVVSAVRVLLPLERGVVVRLDAADPVRAALSHGDDDAPDEVLDKKVTRIYIYLCVVNVRAAFK